MQGACQPFVAMTTKKPLATSLVCL